MKIAFIYNHGISSTLTKFFTGSKCYHVGWVDEINNRFYDMNLIRRRRVWPCYNLDKVILTESPVQVSSDFLEGRLDTDEEVYGWKDYILFALRPLYHLFGKSTRNANGVICSEMVYNDLVSCGWHKRFSEVPSPADLELEILGKKDYLNA